MVCGGLGLQHPPSAVSRSVLPVREAVKLNGGGGLPVPFSWFCSASKRRSSGKDTQSEGRDPAADTLSGVFPSPYSCDEPGLRLSAAGSPERSSTSQLVQADREGSQRAEAAEGHECARKIVDALHTQSSVASASLPEHSMKHAGPSSTGQHASQAVVIRPPVPGRGLGSSSGREARY